MNRFTALFLALFAASLALFGQECSISSRILSGNVEEWTLDNGVITVKCTPEISGLLNGFAYRPEKREFISPLKHNVSNDDLLPRSISVNNTGLRELVKGTKMQFQTFYALKSKSADKWHAELVMEGRGFYSWNLAALKRVSLRQGESRVRMSLTLTAGGNMAKPIRLWLNGIAEMQKERDIVLIPVRKEPNEKQSDVSIQPFSSDGIFVDRELEPQTVFASARAPWIARLAAKRPGVLVLTLDESFLNGGYFSAWKHGFSPIHTTEAIYGEMALQKGESRTICSEYIYFAGLTGLRAVVDSYGLDLQGKTLLIASAAPVPEGKVTLRWRDAAGNRKDLGDFSFPALKPGRVAKIEIKAPLPPQCTLEGKLSNGSAFELPNLIFDVAK